MAHAATMLGLPNRLTLAEARDVTARLGGRLAEAPEGGVLIVDGGELGHFDSSALAVLLELQRRAAASGRLLRVERMPARLAELAGLYGVGGLLGMSASA